MRLGKKGNKHILKELSSANDRVMKPGAGRKIITQTNPGLHRKLERMLEPVTRGHPESVLNWTCLSTRTLAAALDKLGFRVSHTKVGGIC